MCASSFKLDDLIKGGLEMLSPKRIEGEESISGRVFAKCSVWAVYLTETIAHGGDYHCFADEKLSLRKDS